MIVFAVVTLVKAAKEKGIPVAEAAMNNAPVFLNFSVIALVCAVLLLIAEALDFMKNKAIASKLVKARWATSLIAVAATMVFSLGIVPPMKQLLPEIQTNQEARAKFDGMHKSSERVFGIVILFALISLLLPAFSNSPSLAADKPKSGGA
ncbi:MAG: hypothetical protein HYX67_11730 [Candidatus Melainabacteria bacterium]|nr:hypothetical protein [Candidatus Melainabacteria bacterium]